MDNADWCLANVSKLRIPVIFIHGSDDMIVDPKSSEFCFEKAKSKDIEDI